MTSEAAYDPEEVAAVFGRAAAAYDTVIPFFARFGERLVEVAQLAPGQRVIDVGCGRGAALLPAARAVGGTGRVTGVDLSEDMVALLAADLEAGAVANAQVRRGNAQALDLPDAAFDVALSSMVLHLLPDPKRAASELLRVLVPGGRCAALAPTGGVGWEQVFQLFAEFAPRAGQTVPVPFRSDFDLRATLAGAGFEIASAQEIELAFHFAGPAEWWAWGWSNGIRALYEVLPAVALGDLRRRAFDSLARMAGPDGILFVQRAAAVVARKPA